MALPFPGADEPAWALGDWAWSPASMVATRKGGGDACQEAVDPVLGLGLLTPEEDGADGTSLLALQQLLSCPKFVGGLPLLPDHKAKLANARATDEPTCFVRAGRAGDV